MKVILRTSRFKRDVKRMQRQGKKIEKLKALLAILVNEEPLAPSYRDHVLVGQYKSSRECHIEPDWLLIYESTEDEIIFIRAGSHSALFR